MVIARHIVINGGGWNLCQADGDALGNLISVVDQQGDCYVICVRMDNLLHRHRVPLVADVVSVVGLADPGSGTTTYAYDASGQPIEKRRNAQIIMVFRPHI